ncbi:FG-GAP repeat domain-containing protein [Caenispirillum bisanense]|uniref:Repeat domain-containing protein n=1 Tax=Caenispirillum bisanense TaxID=414052 RepID=A0A286GJD4_9PROT|nr:VCBS repeat-containing protein [Caenispirillum bisanense]SOD95645.1 Repeat domain-containing protein [Caenispirillum bisanense]
MRPALAAAFVALAAAVTAATPPAAAQGLPTIAVGAAPAKVVEVVRGPDGGPFIRTEGGRWLRPRVSIGHISLVTAQAPPAAALPPPEGLLPQSTVAVGGRDIAAAWLAGATDRYGHAVLGDGLEAGRLAVETAAGERLAVDLPDAEVFEDLTPRLADLDGDGRDEVLVVRSHRDVGAALVVYGVTEAGALAEKAATPPLGLPNRWLNPVGVADLDGDGAPEVVTVETPHIGGILRVWHWRDGRLVRGASEGNVSNHAVRSPVLGLHALTDVDGDGRPDVVVPNQSRNELRIFSFADGRPRELATVPLPGAVATAIVPVPRGLVFGSTLGDLVAISW